MPPALEVEPNPELPMALEAEELLFTADELLEAVPAELLVAKRLRVARPVEEPVVRAALEEEVAEASEEPEAAA